MPMPVEPACQSRMVASQPYQGLALSILLLFYHGRSSALEAVYLFPADYQQRRIAPLSGPTIQLLKLLLLLYGRIAVLQIRAGAARFPASAIASMSAVLSFPGNAQRQ